LQNPSVLFADEPTTGLDATSAHQVIQTLKDLARRGRTIIITIHQPRSEIWDLFDRVILLSHGSCVYSGETKESLPYFQNLGYPVPAFVNPAEYLIELAAIDNRSKETEAIGLERLQTLKKAWSQRQENALQSVEPGSKSYKCKTARKVSVWRQFSVLTRRGVVVSLRDPKGLLGTILEAVVVGITLGYTFYRLDDSLQGIRSRQGAFYTASSVQGYLMLVYEIYRMTEDIQIFDRDYSEGILNVTPFLLARRAAKVLEDIPVRISYNAFER
jgi:ABC-2 family transporter